MGTNYYWHERVCPCCGSSKKETHIGKCSAGWTFSFHGDEYVRSFKDWITVFKVSEGVIKDEYGDTISLDEFCKLVKDMSKNKRNHAREFMGKYGEHWLDEKGNSFSAGEFC